MNIGDKILCKKSLIRKFNGDYKVVLKNKTYEILNIENGHVEKSENRITTTSENGNKCWSFNKKETYFTFSEYFMTVKDIRKQKLENLNKL